MLALEPVARGAHRGHGQGRRFARPCRRGARRAAPLASADQVFYFGPEGLLRRHDYIVEIVADVPVGEYTDEHQIHGGISFPTLRRAVRRQPDGAAEPDPALVTIDISDVTVEPEVAGAA